MDLREVSAVATREEDRMSSVIEANGGIQDRRCGVSDAFAVSVAEAAKLVGLSRAGFYQEFLGKPPRVSVVKYGRRSLIVVKELHEAFDRFVEEQRLVQTQKPTPGAPGRADRASRRV
jgi:hypothetical protein